MPHPKQHITDLAAICKKRNIRHVVISPGSRSAPLIKAFYEAFGDKCHSIVDERSAAYFALGMALYEQEPVVLICTSGTAVLNYSPAIAEAYYQQVPLIAITADRPHEWIDQYDNQTLRQNDVYHNYIKAAYELPQVITTDDDLWYAHRIINNALNSCTGPNHGPVQINVPLTEPLYDELPPRSETLKITVAERFELSLKIPDELIAEWKAAKRIMIIHGQEKPGSETAKALQPLSKDNRVIIVAENISNFTNRYIVTNSNLALSVQRDRSPEYPDLILHSGGQVVSKALTGYLRRADKVKLWRLGNDGIIIDTFKQVTRILPYAAADIYHSLSAFISKDNTENYRNSWMRLSETAWEIAEKRLISLENADVHVFKQISESIPEGTIVVLGNSSVIRYSQLFRNNKKLLYYSNRGVSGIDGVLSTAAGIAASSSKLTIAVLGDLGFLYDSNAMWNRELPSNLRIIVINNQGGGIFHILKGPSEHPGFKKFIEANHPVNIAKLADAYGLKYLISDNAKSLSDKFPEFIGRQKVPVLFEIKTDAEVSALAFRKLMANS